jgi:putative transposase
MEYPGAVYHVISRGNYRKDLFTVGKSGNAFEKALFEVVERCDWKLHGYVIMSNHYHLAVEIRQPNLVDGMRWLQSTFANRFNRFTGERGHVFQGRYKSLLIEPDRPLSGLVDYIHLNPVRAGIVSVENLKDYRLSSFPKFFSKTLRPGLVRSDFLMHRQLPDSPYGMRKYWEQLHLSEAKDVENREELRRRYCRGWIVAGDEYRRQIQARYSDQNLSESTGKEVLRAMKEERWEEMVLKALKLRNKSEADIRNEGKAVEWKVEIAVELRKNSTASNPWIAGRLHMGHPTRVSNLVHEIGRL